MSKGIFIECDVCGNEEHFSSKTKKQAILSATKRGWIFERLDFCSKECKLKHDNNDYTTENKGSHNFMWI